MSAANLSTTLFLNGLSLAGVAGAGLAKGETGQAEPDWPAPADWLQNRLLPKAALRPGLFLPSLASTDAPQCIASRHDLCRHCVQCSVMASLPPVIFRRITSWDALPSVTVLRLTECKKWSLSRKNVPNKCSRCAGCYYLD